MLWEKEDGEDVRFCLLLFLIIKMLAFRKPPRDYFQEFSIPSLVILVIDSDATSGCNCDHSGERVELE